MDKSNIEEFVDKVFSDVDEPSGPDAKVEKTEDPIRKVALKEGVLINNKHYIKSGTEITIEKPKKEARKKYPGIQWRDPDSTKRKKK